MQVTEKKITKISQSRHTIPKLRQIVTVGFDQKEFAQLKKFKNGSIGFEFIVIDNSFSTYQWLLANVDKAKNHPAAILLNLQYLINDDFRLIDQINSNEKLKFIPLIAINSNGVNITAQKLIKNGIDDVYSFHSDWYQMIKRIEFLNKFKEDIIQSTEVKIKNTTYKVPTGKRLFDITFASLALLAISPFLILIALAIKLTSKGPIFYYSKRAGTAYHVFDFIKFRSMRVDADSVLKDLAHLNQYDGEDDENEGPNFFKLQNDPRVTTIGKFIRKTSIDEIPQLINVLKGDMSIVGNRPLPLYEAEQLTNDDWIKRFHAPAGLTGLWQISERGKKNMSVLERIQLDIDYAESTSFGMDLKIISKTIPAMIQDEQV